MGARQELAEFARLNVEKFKKLMTKRDKEMEGVLMRFIRENLKKSSRASLRRRRDFEKSLLSQLKRNQLRNAIFASRLIEPTGF